MNTLPPDDARRRRRERYAEEIINLNRYIDLCSDNALADDRVQRARERLAWIEEFCENGPAKTRRVPTSNPTEPGWHPELRPNESIAEWQTDILFELARILRSGGSA